ncbi:MAG: hypothetical protein ACKVQA_03545 [Burkholderiales bacterium]
MKHVLVALASVVGFGIHSAHAELHLGGGLEYFDWREDTTPQVKETGPVAAFHVAWTQDKSSGMVFGAKGRVWTGSVDYEGADLVTNQPLSGTTDYFGLQASDPVYVDFPSSSALPAGFYYQPESHMNVVGLRLEYQLR